MAHLTCTQHARRVHVLDNAVVIHRGRDTNRCESRRVTIAGHTFEPEAIATYTGEGARDKQDRVAA